MSRTQSPRRLGRRTTRSKRFPTRSEPGSLPSARGKRPESIAGSTRPSQPHPWACDSASLTLARQSGAGTWTFPLALIRIPLKSGEREWRLRMKIDHPLKDPDLLSWIFIQGEPQYHESPPVFGLLPGQQEINTARLPRFPCPVPPQPAEDTLDPFPCVLAGLVSDLLEKGRQPDARARFGEHDPVELEDEPIYLTRTTEAAPGTALRRISRLEALLAQHRADLRADLLADGVVAGK